MVPLHAFRKTIALLATAVVFAILACLLPENEYQRWQLLDGTIHKNARWIYERCHFDPTPIDVVFLGPSRIEAGVEAQRLGGELAKRNLPANVVNFSLPETGRDINYIIAEQLFSTKKPKLVVLGVTEKPSRFGHSAFKYIAERSAVVAPGYLADFDYFSNLIYLPFRQMWLFFADLFPEASGLTKTFDPTEYQGPSIDTTGSRTLPDGTFKEGEAPASAAELARGVHKLEAGMHAPILPRRLADYEFGDERHYVDAIAALAHNNGARVAFLLLPYYTGPSALQEEGFYRRYGPIWNAGFLSSHAEWYADYGHLVRTGAREVTDWLVDRVAHELTSKEASK